MHLSAKAYKVGVEKTELRLCLPYSVSIIENPPQYMYNYKKVLDGENLRGLCQKIADRKNINMKLKKK